MSPSVKRMYGYTVEEALQITTDDILKPEGRAMVANNIRVRSAEFLSGIRTHYIDEVEQFRKDGSLIWVEFLSHFVFNDETGQIEAYGTSRDITARKMAEEALVRNEQHFRGLIENVPGAITILGPDSKLKYISPSTEKVMGFRPEEVIGMNPMGLTHQEDLPKLLEIFADLAESPGKVITTEYRFLHKDGSWRWIESTISNLFHEPAIEGMVFNFHDISDRHEAEKKIMTMNEELEERVRERTIQMEAALKELEAFSYSVSHDLRAPLRTIDGFTSAILEDFYESLPEEAKNFFIRISDAAKHMSQLINDLLNLSRVSRSNMNKRNVDMSAMVGQIANELCQQFPERKVDLIIRPELKVKADSAFLRIALENLINNAWKFTSKEKDARIEFGLSTEDGQMIFFIRDNGAGFDMTYQERLFVAFQRLHSSHDYPGTGVGLAIVHRIIQQHGGRIWADSHVGQGTTFYFTLAD